MAKKGANHKLMDPRMGEIVQNNAVLPGGPPGTGDTNNPYPALQSTDVAVQTQNLYGDAIGVPSNPGVNPLGVPRSKLPQQHPISGGKLNRAPANTQQQMPTEMWEAAEGSRYNAGLAQRGLPTANPFLGLTGFPATPAPGAVPSQFSASGQITNTLPMGNQISPSGTTPQKYNKKGKRVA